MKLHLIACEIFSRELAAAVAGSPHRVSQRYLPFKLHEKGGSYMREELQKAIDEEPEGVDAIVLAFCLCNNGVLGLVARKAPLIVFRSHDCVACLIGDRARYDAERERTPGTYWLSPGWVEQASGDASAQLSALSPEPAPDDPKWLDLLEKYGEDNARFLWDEERKALASYERIVYIDTGLGPKTALEDEARLRAARLGLRYESMPGDRSWIAASLSGDWDEKLFLRVPPGFRIAARYDDSIMDSEQAPK